MNYDQLIYELLSEYLPGISSTLSDLKLMFSISTAQIMDIRKFLLWLLVAFLSTKILRWRYRI